MKAVNQSKPSQPYVLRVDVEVEAVLGLEGVRDALRLALHASRPVEGPIVRPVPVPRCHRLLERIDSPTCRDDTTQTTVL